MSRDVNVSNSVIANAPAGSSTVVLWDSTADPALGTTLARRRAFTKIRRILVRIFADQAVTVKFQDLTVGSTTWRTINGGGSGDVTTASTYYERDFLCTSDDHRITVTTTTGPSTWECSVRLVESDRGLGQ